jgi:hypothetical protein
MLQYSLEHTAPIRVAGKTCHIVKDVINDEINLLAEKMSFWFIAGYECILRFGTHDFNALLNHVIPVLVLNATKHVVVKLG